MIHKIPTKAALTIAASAAFSIAANAQTVVYTEDFTGFTAGVEYTKGTAFYTLLFNGDDNAFWDVNFTNDNNVKTLEYEGSETSFYWGSTTGPSDRFADGVLKPQIGTNTDYKGVGVFLSPSTFSAGSGTYTLTYDIVGVDAANEQSSAAIQIATFSGIGVDAENTVGFDLAGATLFNDETAYPSVTDSRFRTQGTATLVDYVAQSVDTTTPGTFSVNFSYNEGETVGLVFIGFATDVQFDNLSISSAVEPTGWAGYPIEDGYVNTGAFMGWLEVSADPWIWSVSLNSYIYLPEGHVDGSGAWTYIPQ